MTKERRLAIEMWKGIRDMLSASDELSGAEIIRYKEMFCEEHRLRWYWDCWFCQYMPSCSKCPLKYCAGNSLYNTVIDMYEEKDVRIEACNNIIKALGGKA